MKPFTEACRYEYDLTPDSVVIDVGGYRGDWTAEIFKRYQSRIWVFEPCMDFYPAVLKRFLGNKKIRPVNYAVGATPGTRLIGIKGDMTGFFTGGPQQAVRIMAIDHILQLIGPCDLLKLNCEGAEFEILGRILDCQMAHMIRNIQVQFHGVGTEPEKQQSKLYEELQQTHRLTYDAPWVWTNFERNE